MQKKAHTKMVMMLLKAHHKIFNSQHLFFSPVIIKHKNPLRYQSFNENEHTFCHCCVT